MKTINLKIKDKKLQFETDSLEKFLVGDNNCYRICFEADESRSALFSVFKKDGREQKILLDKNMSVKIPLWCLKKGFFSVGVVSDGYATTPVIFEVQSSIIDEECAETEDENPTVAQQLIALVNGLSLEGVSEEKVKEAVEKVISEKVFQETLGLTLSGGKICVETEE